MFALILGVIIVGLIIALFPSIEFRLKLWLKARNDYKTARGTMHLKLLHKCLSNLRLKIKQTQTDLEKTKKYKEELTVERKKELEVAATTYLVNLEFTNIPGIGPILKNRVMRTCFDGTLQSLRRAWRVYGIGEERAYAISAWVNQAQRKLPLILGGAFPGKEKINEKYDHLEKETNQRIMNTETFLKDMLELEKESSNELAKLKRIKVSTFLNSCKGDVDASEAVTNYLLGCFPEWRRIPHWFKTLIEDYGETS